MAAIGQALTSPESGWRRYEDTDSRIKFTGNGVINFTSNTSASYNGGSCTYTPNDTQSQGCKIQFKFYGTKLRLITLRLASSYRYSANIQIIIDGTIIETFSEYGSTLYQLLAYEKVGLTLGIHTIVITNLDNYAINLDAIDIDDTGYLVHPILNQVSDITTMQVGDYTPCRYTATTSGQAGYFSELGTCIANEIPLAGTTTPDGLFYFIKTKHGTLVADRVIQIGISWDILNAAKYIEGKHFIKPEAITDTLTSNTSSNQIRFIFNSSDIVNGNINYNPWVLFDRKDEPASIALTFKTFNTQLILDLKSVRNLKSLSFLAYGNLVMDIYSSIDNVNYNKINTFTTNHGAWSEVNFLCNCRYIKLVFVSDNYYTAGPFLGDMRIYENTPPYFIRSLNGGCAYLDAYGNKSLTDQNLGAWPSSNEWDTYIVNSTLNDKIVKGDDNIWHKNFGNQKGSWCKETVITGLNTNIHRVYRYNNTFSWNNSIDVSGGWCGFRPVLNYVESDIASEVIY